MLGLDCPLEVELLGREKFQHRLHQVKIGFQVLFC